MRARAGVAVATAVAGLLTTGTGADAASCVALRDARGDVAVAGQHVAGTERADLDLTQVKVWPADDGLYVELSVVNLADADAALWSVGFDTASNTRVVASAWSRQSLNLTGPPQLQYEAGREGYATSATTGWADAQRSTITIHVPAKATGGTARVGRLLTGFTASAEDVLRTSTTPVAATRLVSFSDHARSSMRVQLGVHCGYLAAPQAATSPR